MSKSPAFQFYPDDFMGGAVSTMTVEEVGAYILLLCHDWNGDGFVVDDERLARLCRTSPKRFAQLWRGLLHECFAQGEDGKWRNPRLQLERAKQAAWKEKCSRGGRASAEHRGMAAGKGTGKGSSTTLPTTEQLEGQVKGNTLTPSPSPTPQQDPKGAAQPTAAQPDAPAGDPPGGDKPKRVRTKGEPAPWMGEVRRVWRERYDGEPTQGVANTLRPLVKRHGEAEVLARFARYVSRTDGGFVNVPKFAATWGEWGESVAPSSVPDWVDGWMSDELERATRPAGYHPPRRVA